MCCIARDINGPRQVKLYWHLGSLLAVGLHWNRKSPLGSLNPRWLKKKRTLIFYVCFSAEVRFTLEIILKINLYVYTRIHGLDEVDFFNFISQITCVIAWYIPIYRRFYFKVLFTNNCLIINYKLIHSINFM